MSAEPLERRRLLAAEVFLSEFLASNSTSLPDGNGIYNDWIEIHNAGDESADLSGWYLTDEALEPTRWTFPAAGAPILDPGEFAIVFASGNDDTDPQGYLHTNFALSASGEYVALVRPDLTIASEFGPQQTDYPPQRSDVSYGIDSSVLVGDPARFFLTPTPGAANVDPVAGFVQDTTFSVDRGYFTESFTVEIASPTDGATIVYTTDGSDPTLANGVNVTDPAGGAPVASVFVDTTTTLRAAAFKDGFQPTNVDTQTYLFLADVIGQSNQPPGFPTSWGSAPAADYEMDPEITTDPAYTDDLLAGLRDLPALSLVSDVDGLFGPTGIYTDPQNDTLEIPVSAEYLLADGSTGFQIDAGLKIAGGASRRPNNSPKHSMSLRFRASYGDAKLENELFEDSPVTEFNSLQLRAVYNNSWIHWDQGQRGRGTLIRDQFIRDSLLAAGQDDAGRGHYSHVYLNGLYWGVYNLHERADSSHFAEYNGGDADDYDALNGGSPIDGTADSWNNVKAVVAGGDWNAIVQVLDVDNFIDWTLVQAFGGNADLKTNGNWRAAGGGTAQALWRLYAWDSERTLEGVTAKPPNTITDATGLFADLIQIPEFVVRLGDRIQKHFTGNGAFTPQSSTERWNARAEELETAIVAESARWGDYRRDVHPRGATPLLYRRDQNWIPEVQRVVNEYFPGRTDFVLDQFVSLSWMSPVQVPQFRVDGEIQFGGEVAAGSELRLTSTDGAIDNTIYYTTDGTDPRLQGGAISPTAILYDQSTTQSTLIPSGSVWKYSDNGTDLGASWQSPAFDDSPWASGPAQLGFGDGDEATVVSFGGNASNKHRTTYFRKTFDVTSTDLTQLTLRLRRDDGAAVYLNGVEIARDNLPAGPIDFGTRALAAAPDDGNNWLEFDVPVSLLVLGTNTLAVEIHQNSPTSSDLSFDAELIATTQTASPIVLSESLDIRARALNASNEWSAIDEALFLVPNEPASTTNLRVTEIHYNPAGDGDAEFLELTNITSGEAGVTVDLDGVTVTDGPSNPLSIPVNNKLAPGESALLVRDLAAFTAAYPNVDSQKIVGEYPGKLSNSGERIRVIAADGSEIADFDYGTSDPWPKWADGRGGSLVLRIPASTPASQLGKPYHYVGSVKAGGSPGAAEPAAPGVLINEVLAHTDEPLSDLVELYNPGEIPIDVSGWFLSDDGDVPKKFRIPDGTIVAAGGYLVFDESDFNPALPNATSLQPFALSGSEGDSVWLFVGDGTDVIGFSDHVFFDATFNGVSLGRMEGSGGRIVPLANRSPGLINGTFRSSDLVLSEIHYHPGDPSAQALGIDPALSAKDLEFVEVANATSDTIDMTNWRLRGEVDFDFPAAAELAADQTIVVVSFDPMLPANSNRLDAFRAHYGIGSGVNLVGPFDGSLSNSHGLVKLQAPDLPPAEQPTLFPNVTVDEVLYDDMAPWPVAADGLGASLQRIAASTLGVYSDSWRGESPTPGNVPARPSVESVTINDGEVQRSSVTTLSVQFDRLVEAPASAFVVTHLDSQTAVGNLQVQLSSTAGKTLATITFGSDALVMDRPLGNSLADGKYELRIIAALIQTLGTDHSMAADHHFGEAAADSFFRHFGDSDGDRDVDGQDYGRFGLTFLRTSSDADFNSALDFDGDGDVDGQDYGQFGLRFLKSLDAP